MGWTVEADGFIVPEGWLNLNKGPEDPEYIAAKAQFTKVFLNNDVTRGYDASGAKYGEANFTDIEVVKFYFENTPTENLKTVVYPFYKKNILPNIKVSVNEYIKRQYDPDGITPEEKILIDGFKRYLVKLEGNENDIKRAVRKVEDIGLSDVNSWFFKDHAQSAAISATAQAAVEGWQKGIINTFFEEQFGGGDSKAKTIGEAEQLQLNQLKDLNLSTGAADATGAKGKFF